MTWFEWDPQKARTNERKHGVNFAIAQHAFTDPDALSERDRIEGGERRWQTLGLAGGVLCYWSPTRLKIAATTKSSASSQPAAPTARREKRFDKERQKNYR